MLSCLPFFVRYLNDVHCKEKFLFYDPLEKGSTTAEIFSIVKLFLTNGSCILVASFLFAEMDAQPCSQCKISFRTAGEERIHEVKRGLARGLDVLDKRAIEHSGCSTSHPRARYQIKIAF